MRSRRVQRRKSRAKSNNNRGFQMNDIKVGLIGFGNIGAGVVKLLQENAGVIRDKVGACIVLKRIADLDITTDRGVKVDPAILTADVNAIFDDPDISVVIE